MPVTPTVCAVVVTRDRRELLRECLAALCSQTRALDRILVVDNAGSDGSRGMLESDFPDADVVALSANTGPAGGFHEGLKSAHRAGFDWIWLLHDDSVAAPSALQCLLEATTAVAALPTPAVVASKVVSGDGELDPGSVPRPYYKHVEAAIESYGHGLQPIRSARSVSLLVRGSAVDRHGLPDKRYFGWNDDIEYTARILRSETGYLAPRSVVCHRIRPGQPGPASSEAFCLHVRNTLFMLRGHAWGRGEKVRLALIVLSSVASHLRRDRLRPRSVRLVLGAVREGLV